MYEYRIEPLKVDKDALIQECRIARIACSGTLVDPPQLLKIGWRLGVVVSVVGRINEVNQQ